MKLFIHNSFKNITWEKDFHEYIVGYYISNHLKYNIIRYPIFWRDNNHRDIVRIVTPHIPFEWGDLCEVILPCNEIKKELSKIGVECYDSNKTKILYFPKTN